MSESVNMKTWALTIKCLFSILSMLTFSYRTDLPKSRWLKTLFFFFLFQFYRRQKSISLTDNFNPYLLYWLALSKYFKWAPNSCATSADKLARPEQVEAVASPPPELPSLTSHVHHGACTWLGWQRVIYSFSHYLSICETDQVIPILYLLAKVS